MKNILYIGHPKSIHDIKWATFFSKKTDYKIYFIAEKEACESEKELVEELKTKNIHLLHGIHSFSLSQPLQSWKSIVQLRSIVKKYNINLVHVLFSAPFSLWVNFLAIPSLITNRGSDVLLEIPKLLDQGVKGRLFFYLFKKAFTKSAITATSSKQVERVAELFSKEAQLIRTGVDVDRIARITKNIERENIVFSPRYFQPIYNIELQIEAIKLLPLALLKEYKFVFIKGKNGKKEYANKLEQELQSLKESKQLNYEILEGISQEEMFMYYGKSRLTIMTPLSDGTPNSALEAMSAQCPLIVPALDYDKQLFTKTCLILPKNTPKELAELMEKSLDNYDKNLLKNAFEAVSKHGNREVEMKKLEVLYESI